MKYGFLYIITILLYSCCFTNNESSTKQNNSVYASKNNSILIRDTIWSKIKGDFNGDGVMESAFLVCPNTSDLTVKYSVEKENHSNSYVSFSNSKIPHIPVQNCIGGIIANEKDLNNDGSDEIGILPYWWTSDWMEYFVYCLNKNAWQQLVNPISVKGSMYDEGIDVIKKHPAKFGQVIIQYSTSNDSGEWIVKEKIERINH